MEKGEGKYTILYKNLPAAETIPNLGLFH